MMNATLGHLALRARFLGTTVATTGGVQLSATSTGYARASGSFLTDNFAVGMEVVAAGFLTAGNNGMSVITAVTALTMTVSKKALSTVSSTDLTPTIVAGIATVAEAATTASITAGVPLLRGFDNVAIAPVSGALYVEESFIPGVGGLRSFPASGAHAEELGLYIVRWFGLSNLGISAIRKSVDAVKARFTPGTNLSLSDGTTVAIRGGLTEPAVRAGQITPTAGGFSYVSIEVPWRCNTTNLVAA